MERLFRLDSKKFRAVSGSKVIKKEELSELIKAESIIEKANEEAQEILKKAEEDYQKRFDEGLELGREEGKGEYTMKIMETVLSSVDSLEGLEKQLVDVVLNSVVKIIGAIPDDERVIRIVRKGLNSVRGEKRVTIRVSTQDEPYVREDLKAFLLSPDGSSGYIEVIGDPSMGLSDCIIETQLGVVEASLKNQLKRLSSILYSRVNSNNQG